MIASILINLGANSTKKSDSDAITKTDNRWCTETQTKGFQNQDYCKLPSTKLRIQNRELMQVSS